MQCAPFGVSEVVTVVVNHEINYSPFGQGGRFIENQTAFLTRALRGPMPVAYGVDGGLGKRISRS